MPIQGHAGRSRAYGDRDDEEMRNDEDDMGAGCCAKFKLCASGSQANYIGPAACNNACGAGPFSPQYLPSTSGSCYGQYSTSGAVINCSLPSSCGLGRGGCA